MGTQSKPNSKTHPAQKGPAKPLGIQHILSQPIALAIKLVETEVPRWESLLSKSLLDPKFQSYIKTTIENEMKGQLSLQSDMWGTSGAKAETIAKGMLKELESSARRQLEASPAYHALKASIDSLKKDLAQTKPGVWVTDNKAYVIITGSILSLAGLAATYRYQKGNALFDHTINGKNFKILNGGKLKLDVTPRYNPHDREVGGQLGQFLKLKGFEAGHRFDFDLKHGEFTKAQSGLTLKIDLPLHSSLGVTENLDFLAKTSKTDLTLNGKIGAHASWGAGTSLEGLDIQKYSLNLGWDGPKISGTLGATVQPKGATGPAWNVNLGLKIPL